MLCCTFSTRSFSDFSTIWGSSSLPRRELTRREPCSDILYQYLAERETAPSLLHYHPSELYLWECGIHAVGHLPQSIVCAHGAARGVSTGENRATTLSPAAAPVRVPVVCFCTAVCKSSKLRVFHSIYQGE